jgi:RNA polymerase sigma-B factor
MVTKTSEQEEKEIRILLTEYKLSFDSKVKNRIVKYHLSMVEKIARSYSQKYKEQFDDLVQVGCLGLIHAIDKFDLNHSVSFKTYSSHFIAGEMKHYLRDYYSLVKLPRELQELLPRISRARQSLTVEKGTEPTESEIAAYLDLPVDKVSQTIEMENISATVSLDQQISSFNSGSETDNSAFFISQLEDKKYQSFQLAQEDRIILHDAITSIREQSRQVLEYAFYQDLSQTEISKLLGISQMQVSRRLKSAVKEVWEILNTRVTPW